MAEERLLLKMTAAKRQNMMPRRTVSEQTTRKGTEQLHRAKLSAGSAGSCIKHSLSARLRSSSWQTLNPSNPMPVSAVAVSTFQLVRPI